MSVHYRSDILEFSHTTFTCSNFIRHITAPVHCFTEQELDALNKIVTAYLDIAEVHTLNKEPMYMKDWLENIDDYLKMIRRDILTSSGHISHKQAIEKAHAEYDKYRNRLDDTLSPVEKDFIESIGMLEQITDSSKK